MVLWMAAMQKYSYSYLDYSSYIATYFDNFCLKEQPCMQLYWAFHQDTSIHACFLIKSRVAQHCTQNVFDVVENMLWFWWQIKILPLYFTQSVGDWKTLNNCNPWYIACTMQQCMVNTSGYGSTHACNI